MRGRTDRGVQRLWRGGCHAWATAARMQPPQGLYAGAGEAEDWLAISVADDSQWQALVEVLGRPEWALDEALAGVDGRRQAHDLLDDELADWARATETAPKLPSSYARPVCRRLAAITRGCCSSIPQYLARGFYEPCEHPFVGEPLLPTMPYHFDGLDTWLKRATPTLGQHNQEILGGLLGLSGTGAGAAGRTGCHCHPPRRHVARVECARRRSQWLAGPVPAFSSRIRQRNCNHPPITQRKD